jgi:hypothetical protein
VVHRPPRSFGTVLATSFRAALVRAVAQTIPHASFPPRHAAIGRTAQANPPAALADLELAQAGRP